MILLTI